MKLPYNFRSFWYKKPMFLCINSILSKRSIICCCKEIFSYTHTNSFTYLQAKLRADQPLSTPLSIVLSERVVSHQIWALMIAHTNNQWHQGEWSARVATESQVALKLVILRGDHHSDQEDINISILWTDSWIRQMSHPLVQTPTTLPVVLDHPQEGDKDTLILCMFTQDQIPHILWTAFLLGMTLWSDLRLFILHILTIMASGHQ